MPRLRVEFQPGELELERAGELDSLSRNPIPETLSELQAATPSSRVP